MHLRDLVVKRNGGIRRGASAALAKAVGVSKTTASDWVRGRMQISEAMLPKVAAYLGVAATHLDAQQAVAEARIEYLAKDPGAVSEELRELREEVRRLRVDVEDLKSRRGAARRSQND